MSYCDANGRPITQAQSLVRYRSLSAGRTRAVAARRVSGIGWAVIGLWTGAVLAAVWWFW